MKIIVSHAQKQHVYRLALALHKSNKLLCFFTSVYGKKSNLIYKFVKKNSKIEKVLNKRSLMGLDDNLVKQTVLPIIVEIIINKIRGVQFLKGNYARDRLHDWMVSMVQYFYEYDMIIAYERQSYNTFKVAKKRGKITILDLASIHPTSQREINSKYNNIVTGFKDNGVLEKDKIIKENEYELADYVLVLSEFAKDSCIKAGIPVEKLHIVHLGVDIKNFNIKTVYDHEKFEILFVSGVRHLKGIQDLIEVYSQLNLQGAKLTIVGGTGDALEYVQEHVSSNIQYIPYLQHDQLKDVYRKASIFVLPSYMDSWAQVVSEAMACGTPVIVSENTGAKDIVQDGESGFVVETANKEQLAEKITYFYNNRNDIERMGRNARKCVEHLTWENYYRQINEIIEDIGSKTI